MVFTASNVAYTQEQWLSYVPPLAYIAKCVLDYEPDLDMAIFGMYVICLLCCLANLWWVLECPGTTALQGFLLLRIKSVCVIRKLVYHSLEAVLFQDQYKLILTNQELELVLVLAVNFKLHTGMLDPPPVYTGNWMFVCFGYCRLVVLCLFAIRHALVCVGCCCCDYWWKGGMWKDCQQSFIKVYII